MSRILCSKWCRDEDLEDALYWWIEKPYFCHTYLRSTEGLAIHVPLPQEVLQIESEMWKRRFEISPKRPGPARTKRFERKPKTPKRGTQSFNVTSLPSSSGRPRPRREHQEEREEDSDEEDETEYDVDELMPEDLPTGCSILQRMPQGSLLGQTIMHAFDTRIPGLPPGWYQGVVCKDTVHAVDARKVPGLTHTVRYSHIMPRSGGGVRGARTLAQAEVAHKLTASTYGPSQWWVVLQHDQASHALNDM